jgi:Mn-dependent DtxR family transcriptional regulator
VVIGQETIVEFIRRIGGEALTSDVAQRFGWYIDDARKELQALQRQGLLTSAYENVVLGLNGAAAPGRQLCWKVTP